jgi:hypothetical protein
MALLNDAFSDNSIINSQQPSVFQQQMPQFSINQETTQAGQYPFWNQNMRQLLMIRQQGNDGDYFMRYTVDANGLKDNTTKITHPFNTVLCGHGKTKATPSGSTICTYCGHFLEKSQQDKQYLETKCNHPIMYCYFNKLTKTCGQCNKNC